MKGKVNRVYRLVCIALRECGVCRIAWYHKLTKAWWTKLFLASHNRCSPAPVTCLQTETFSLYSFIGCKYQRKALTFLFATKDKTRTGHLYGNAGPCSGAWI